MTLTDGAYRPCQKPVPVTAEVKRGEAGMRAPAATGMPPEVMSSTSLASSNPTAVSSAKRFPVVAWNSTSRPTLRARPALVA